MYIFATKVVVKLYNILILYNNATHYILFRNLPHRHDTKPTYENHDALVYFFSMVDNALSFFFLRSVKFLVNSS